MNRINIGGYNRISKARARKLYNENKPFYCCPVKMSPVNMWGGICKIEKERIEEYNSSFDNIIFLAEYYNCNNETGNYLAYYEREEETY